MQHNALPTLGPVNDDLDTALPSMDALVAGTVALMTTWADPCPTARTDRTGQRRLLARKIVANLHLLQRHPCASPALRQVMAQAHQRWIGMLLAPVCDSADEPQDVRPAELH